MAYGIGLRGFSAAAHRGYHIIFGVGGGQDEGAADFLEGKTAPKILGHIHLVDVNRSIAWLKPHPGDGRFSFSGCIIFILHRLSLHPYTDIG